MKVRISFLFAMVLFIATTATVTAQVTGVNYQLRYDTVDCEYEAYLIINEGMTTSLFSRIQSNSQFSIVVPPGSQVSFPTSYNPTANNGSGPAAWTPQNSLSAETYNMNPPVPGNTIENDFYGYVPSLSPTATYDDLEEGDAVLLFSFTVNPTDQCTGGVRMWENNVDPNSVYLGGPNFNNGFTIGGPTQRYQGNSPQIIPDNPTISAETTCAAGLEIDLMASASQCQQPLSYQWSGPDNYSATDQDVAISPAGMINNGTYKVVVTDALGCKDSLEIEAMAKPIAGPDQTSCASSTVTLTGSEPSTGVWSVTPTTGASVGATSGGVATGTFDATATGSYNFIYTAGECADTTVVTVAVQDAGDAPNTINCNEIGTATLSGVGTGTWSVDPSSAGTATIADPTNPNTTVSDFSVGGSYTLVWTLNGCSDSVTFMVNENCGCLISGNTLVPVSPNEFCGTSGAVTIDGNPASPAGTYLWESRVNGGTFAAASGSNAAEDYTTSDLSTGNYTFRRIYSVTGAGACSDTSNTVSLIVKDIPAAPTNMAASPPQLCLGESTSLSVTSVAGATYTWSASPAAGSGIGGSTSNTNTMTPTAVGTYTVSVFATVNGCDSPPSTVTVIVNPVPDELTPQDLTPNNPTTCGGTDGEIEIAGLLANTSYTITYTVDGVPASGNITSDAAGIAIL